MRVTKVGNDNDEQSATQQRHDDDAGDDEDEKDDELKKCRSDASWARGGCGGGCMHLFLYMHVYITRMISGAMATGATCSSFARSSTPRRFASCTGSSGMLATITRRPRRSSTTSTTRGTAWGKTTPRSKCSRGGSRTS
eukprot:8458555-Pyramimonas_sp.AAC.1